MSWLELKTLFGEWFFDLDVPLYVNRISEHYVLTTHDHDFVEISYIVEGIGFHYVSGNIIPIKRGDLFLLPIGTKHVFRPTSYNPNNPLVIYNCIFRPDWFLQAKHTLWSDDLVEFVRKLQEPGAWRQLHDRNDNYMRIMEMLHYEYINRQPGFKDLLISGLTHLLTLLNRSGKLVGTGHSEQPQKISRMESAINYIREHLNEKLTLDQAARVTSLSVSQFHRLFKESTGQNFMEYVHNARIGKCCELLRTTVLPVQQVATEIGYQDLKYFHLLFKKKTGVTPLQYRKGLEK